MSPLETTNIGGTATAASSVGAAAAVATSDKKPQAAPAPKVPVEQVVQQLNELAQTHSQSVEFSVARSAGAAGARVIIMMRDTQTNEVIRQIPSEEMLAIDDAVSRMQGLLFKKEA